MVLPFCLSVAISVMLRRRELSVEWRRKSVWRVRSQAAVSLGVAIVRPHGRREEGDSRARAKQVHARYVNVVVTGSTGGMAC